MTDSSKAVLPGVSVSLSGERLIGGVQTQTTDTNGVYRFDRLSPGAYNVKAELEGFKTFEQRDIRISAGFVATINVRMELGQLQESVTVTGESPTVDTKSNVQQVVMTQDVLEGVPTGRDPWSLAKVIPGVQSNVYDVGGTQAMQASFLTVHGSEGQTLQIDGSTVNWPGGAGGSTMAYYDQGMFEEVNYQTSAMPAEVSSGSIYLNMITKDAGNVYHGDMKYFYSNTSWQSENSDTPELKKFGFVGGNPMTRMYDFNTSGGGPIVHDKLWITGSYRNWRTDRMTIGTKNPDGTPAIDDNLIWNASSKVLYQVGRNHRVSFTYNYNWKERFHRRDGGLFQEDAATRHQTNPARTIQAKYTLVRSKGVFESTFGLMKGTTNYFYQDNVKPTDIRIEDPVRNLGLVAATTYESLPNFRSQVDNTFSYAFAKGGDHLLKVGVQFVRMGIVYTYRTNGDMHIIFNDDVPNSVRIYNTPTGNDSQERNIGYFVQDAWTLRKKLSLNIGFRLDSATGWMPAQSQPAGTFIGARSIPYTQVFSHSLAMWRSGAVYDVTGDGRTAIKASYSRYAAPLGVDRIQRVHPFQRTSGNRSWTDTNGDRIPQPGELGPFSGFPGITSRYPSDGIAWPFSDEVTAGIERQIGQGVRVGAMYYYRTNRDKIGFRNASVPSSAYTPVTVTLPAPPQSLGGTATFYDLSRAYFGQAFQDNVYDNEPILDTNYRGVEITMAKRMSHRWQAMAGLTIGRNRGGTLTDDLNDPNNALIFPTGIVGDDGRYTAKLSGSYMGPADVTFSGSIIVNDGYPYRPRFSVTRSAYPSLTRSSQTIVVNERGDSRYPRVAMADLRVSRPFKFGARRSFTPLIEAFNITNASTVVSLNETSGSRFVAPTAILAPRIVRIGIQVNF